MYSIDRSLANYKSLTKDNLIKKKIVKEGFGIYPGTGMEVFLHLYGELEDGRCVANTRIVREEPRIFILGKLKEFPALEIAVRTMRMGEKSTYKFSPEYTYFSQEKFKNCDLNLIANLKPEAFKTEISEQKTEEELKKMEVEQSKKYVNLYYDIELIKFDKPRPRKSEINPKERIEQAEDLKLEGNNLFKEKRFMEAIIKYEDARDYLKHLPNDYMLDNYHNLQNSLTLNISNCRINLAQYNYALKNLENNFLFERTPKAFYFKSLCQMHLGDFESSYKNLLELQKILPDKELMKRYFDDYNNFKEETLKQKKDMLKKGIYQSGLYQDKILDIPKKFNLPKENLKENPCFYLDFIINGDEMNPQKIKFEIFKIKEDIIFNCFEIIKNEIKDKKLIGKEINFDFSNEKKNIVLFEKIQLNKKFDNFDEINILPMSEDVLLVIHRIEGEYNIEITTEKKGDEPVIDFIVLGRCFYNSKSIINLVSNNSKGAMKITDFDETINFD